MEIVNNVTTTAIYEWYGEFIFYSIHVAAPHYKKMHAAGLSGIPLSPESDVFRRSISGMFLLFTQIL